MIPFVTSTNANPTSRARLNQWVNWIRRHWLLVFNIVWGIYVLTPFAAPIFMKLGLQLPARVVYLFYSTQCHQLPERSYFLFGDKFMYSLNEINAARGSNNNLMLELRKFIGNAQMGWKVAWSDRMISLWGGLFVASLMYALVRKRLPGALKLLPFVLLLMPMGLDGFTHFLADFQPMGYGFRDTNDWLRILTSGMFSDGFYRGDGLGSFNSLMRLVTGVLAGWGIAFFALPYLDRIFVDGTLV